MLQLEYSQLEPAMMHMRPFPQLIMVDELRNDYRNPMDFCQNLNRVSRLQTALCDVNTIFVCIPFKYTASSTRVWPPRCRHADAAGVWLLVHVSIERTSAGLPHLEVGTSRHTLHTNLSLPSSLTLSTSPPLPSLLPHPLPPPSLSPLQIHAASQWDVWYGTI